MKKDYIRALRILGYGIVPTVLATCVVVPQYPFWQFR